MPRGDRTGPNGMGSQSGRGAGFCSGSTAPGCTTAGGRGGGRGAGVRRRSGGDGDGRGPGRGLKQGMGRGMGRGMGQGQQMDNAPTPAPTSGEDLSRKAQDLEAQIAQIKQQLNERS